MKNAFIIIAAILLSIPLVFIYFAGLTCIMWLPIFMNHWSSIILGSTVTLSTGIIGNKLIYD